MTTEPPVSDKPLLEIRITQINGTITRFAQDDPAQVRLILDSLQPARVFERSLLLLGGDNALTAYSTAHIEQVELLGPNLPVWPFLGGATSVRDVTEAAFQAGYDPAHFVPGRKKAAETAGTLQIGYTEYWTVSGRRLFWEVQMLSREMTRVDFEPFIESLFKAGGLHALTEEGGVAILNTAALVRMVFHPGPPPLPAGAWPVRRL